MMWKVKRKIVRTALCCNNCIPQLCIIVYALILTVRVLTPVGSEFRFYVYQPVIHHETHSVCSVSTFVSVHDHILNLC